jgi:hypothetical protein
MNCCKSQKSNKSVTSMLGGWSFEPEVYDFIVGNLTFGSTIFELGSGAGTGVLAQHYNMVSIEHNLKFVGRYPSKYIFAPMNGYWYDVDIVKSNLPAQYDMILIDGPIGHESKSRIGFYENLHLFDTTKMMVFDDTNRQGERTLFELVYAKVNPLRKIQTFKTFSVIYG